MAGTRQLTEAEREVAKKTLAGVRTKLKKQAKGDADLLWALRRYVYMRLQHDERGNPLQRKLLKLKKMAAQGGKCAACRKNLPERGAELDRKVPMKGYTAANTRLLCHDCHRKQQAKRGFA